MGDWYPTLSQTANAGYERQQNDNASDTSTGFNEYDISLSQLLWDFGSTNAAVDKARLQVEGARYGLIETRQALILEAISAYMNLIRAHTGVQFAKDSEDNIRRQTGLEEAMVTLGSGFSTDVLQSKAQLASAQARLAENEGSLINALNRYKAVFGRVPDNIAELTPVSFPAPFLPTSLHHATDIALETNPSLKNALLQSDIAQQDVKIARADNFFPRIEATGERKYKKNVGGTLGSEQETLAKVEMTFDFNLGFTAVNTLKASQSDLSASTFTAADTRRNIEEQVSNAWQQLETAKRTASHLDNQANIQAAFLELARNERQLGRRSLIDVLSGETGLINAKSDALSAKTDVIIAAYSVLASTGLLDYDIIKRSEGIDVPTPVPPITPSVSEPTPAPTTPVTPVPGQQGRAFDADTNIASARSGRDFAAMINSAETAAAKPAPVPIDLLAEVKAANARLRATLPPQISSQPAAAPVAEVAEVAIEAKPTAAEAQRILLDIDALGPAQEGDEITFELASYDREADHLAPQPNVIPASSDTEVTSTPEAIFVERTVTPEVATEISTHSEPARGPEPAAETAEVEVTAGDPVSGLFQLFDILEQAHENRVKAHEISTDETAALPSVPIEMAERAIKEPVQAAIDTADPKAPDSLVDALDSGLNGLFDALQQAQERLETDSKADAPPAPKAPTTEVATAPASLPSDMDGAAPENLGDTAKSGLSDLFDFFEEAHQRKLSAAKEPAPHTAALPYVPEATAQPDVKTGDMAPTPDTPETLSEAGETAANGLFSFFEDAYQRKLESDRAEKQAKPAVVPVTASTARMSAAEIPAAAAERPQASNVEAPSLFASLGDLFNAET